MSTNKTGKKRKLNSNSKKPSEAKAYQKHKNRTDKQIEEDQKRIYPDGFKMCSKCDVKHKLEMFVKARSRRDGLGRCKLVKQIKKDYSRNGERTNEELKKYWENEYPLGLKYCTYCKIKHTLENFTKKKKSKDGLDYCIYRGKKQKEDNKKRNDKEIEDFQISKYGGTLDDGEKWCCRCEQYLFLNKFDVDKGNDDGLRKYCIGCKNKYTLKYICRSEEEVKQYQKTIYGNLLDGKKTCRVCQSKKSINEFYDNAYRKDGLNSTCKFCSTTKNIEMYKEFKEFMNSMKISCAICGYDKCLGLQFAHLPGTEKKRSATGKLVEPSYFRNYGKDAFLEEIEKCRVLCACCHAVETFGNLKIPRSKLEKRGREFVNKEKHNRGRCMDCHKRVQKDREYIFDFDHRPGTQKIDCVSHMLKLNIGTLECEMNKCDLRCKCCHFIVTKERIEICNSLKSIIDIKIIGKDKLVNIINITMLYFK
jgi:hypothetical protein